jgi:hypothetical protein
VTAKHCIVLDQTKRGGALSNRPSALAVMSEDDEAIRSSSNCPVCGGAMKIMRIIPKVALLLDLRTFQCVDCGHVRQIPLEHAAPLQLISTRPFSARSATQL